MSKAPRLLATFAAGDLHDEWNTIYDFNPLQDRLNKSLYDRLFGSLALPPDALCLDAGCGKGDHTIQFAKRGYRCVGIDISEYVLSKAREDAASAGVAAKVSFAVETLEELSIPSDTFDFVHCRGVLMHVPDWQAATTNLCRVLKPGGKIFISEMNDRSLETAVQLFVRKFSRRESIMKRTPGGIEIWSEENGKPFLVRTANVASLTACLSDCNVDTIRRFADEFWTLNRFPTGFVRDSIIRFNQMWFNLRLPAALSVGNGIVGEKRTTDR
jgi:ubiquinone/menaquinone biosynthesis C-methylase UbiE